MDLVRPEKRAACDPGRADRILQLKNRIRSDPRWQRADNTGRKSTKKQAPRLAAKATKRVKLTDAERVEIARWSKCFTTSRIGDRKELLQAISQRYRGLSPVVVRRIMREAPQKEGEGDGRGH
jgi:hypothetical protein